MYEDENGGTNQNITLTDNPLNYKSIGIEYMASHQTPLITEYRRNIFPIHNASSQNADLSIIYTATSATYYWSALINITNTGIIFGNNRSVEQGANTRTSQNDSPIKITKIIGYNY